MRVLVGGSTYDLGISEMAPRTDAGGDPPSCVRRIVGSQYDLNWRAVKHPGDGSGDVRVSISTADGVNVTVGRDQRSCVKMQNYPLELAPSGMQIVLGAGVARANLSQLKISVNGTTRVVKLCRTCTQVDYLASARPQCADDPLNFDPHGAFGLSIRA